MTEKRFKPVFSGRYNDVFIGVKDNKEDELLMTLDTIDKLNQLSDENEQLKKIRDFAFELAEEPTQHNLWKFRIFLKEYNSGRVM